MAWNGVRCGMELHGMGWDRMARHGMGNGMVWDGMEWRVSGNGMAWDDIEQHGME